MSAIYEGGGSIIPSTGTRSGYVIRRTSATQRLMAGLGPVLRFVDAGLDHLVATLFTWQRRLADRRALESMDDRMLRDIGVSRAEVYQETSKPFWRS